MSEGEKTMSLLFTDEQVKLIKSKNRTTYVKVELLNSDGRKVDSLEGLVTKGTVAINNSGSIRRRCTIEMILKSDLLPQSGGKIFFDKKIRLIVGLLNHLTNEVVWYPSLGLFLINNPSVDYSPTDKKISFEGLDLFSLYDGTMGGQLGYKTTVDINIPISQAIQTTMQSLANITKLNIESTSYTVPYKIEKNPEDTIWSLIQELNNLYMYYESYFDVDGRFIYRKIQEFNTSPTIWDYTGDDSVTAYKNTYNSSNVKNHIIIWGKTNDDGTQAKAELSNTDINSQYNISTIGEKKFSKTNEKLFTDAQCLSEAQYWMKQYSNMNEKITINGINNYLLDVNNLVLLNQPLAGIVGRYLIDDISFDLNFGGTMVANAHKIYD